MSRMLRVLGGIIVLGAALWFLASPRPMETSTAWLLAAGGGLAFRVVIHGIPLSPRLQRGLFYGGAAVLVVALNAFPSLPQWSRYVNLLVLAGLAAALVGAPLKEWFRGTGLPVPHPEKANRTPAAGPLSTKRRILRGLGAFILGMFGGVALAAGIDYLILYGGIPEEVYSLLTFGTGGLACGIRAGGGWRIGLYSGLVASIVPVLLTLLLGLPQDSISRILEELAPAVLIVWVSAMLGGFLKERVRHSPSTDR